MSKHTILLLLVTAACSTAPVSFFGVAPPGKETAFQCAVAQLNIMGYTIEQADGDGGFVRARKQTSGLGTQILTQNTYHDVLTATAFDNPATETTNLRVVVSRIADQDVSLVGALLGNRQSGEDEVAPSDSGKADAEALLFNCGVTNVTGSSSEQGQYLLEAVLDMS